ncbi:hypothetical protein D9M71_195790 [compost metagenome]
MVDQGTYFLQYGLIAIVSQVPGGVALYVRERAGFVIDNSAELMLGQFDKWVSFFRPGAFVESAIDILGRLLGYCQTLWVIAVGTLVQNSRFFAVCVYLAIDYGCPSVRALGLVENGPQFCF